MSGIQEYADLLQDTKALKAKIAEQTMKKPRGLRRWVGRQMYRLAGWLERQCRIGLKDSQ